MARAAFLGLHELERNKSFRCQHQRTTKNVVARKFALFSQPPPLQGSAIVPTGIWRIPEFFSSLSKWLIAYAIFVPEHYFLQLLSRLLFHQPQRSLLHHAGLPLRRAKGTQDTAHPSTWRNKTQTSPTTNQRCWAKAENTLCSFRLCWFLIRCQDKGWNKTTSIFDTTTGTYFCVSVVRSSMYYLL